MNTHRYLLFLVGSLMIALVLILPIILPPTTWAGTPVLQETLTPTAFLYLPYVTRHYPPLEDLEGAARLTWWSPDPSVFNYFRTNYLAHGGSWSLRVEYRKTNIYQFLGAEPRPELRNFSWAQTLEVWVYGQVTLFLKLEDQQLRQADVATLTTTSPTMWTLLRFNYAHTATSIDLAHIKNLFFFPAPGNPTATGVIYLDDISVSSEP